MEDTSTTTTTEVKKDEQAKEPETSTTTTTQTDASPSDTHMLGDNERSVEDHQEDAKREALRNSERDQNLNR